MRFRKSNEITPESRPLFSDLCTEPRIAAGIDGGIDTGHP
jgi:hypothetical protein